ncbi:hypothetical protein DL240_14695 [Lujinxingia litoralis]|uniref:HTH luxR-type domain-containing protein n=1 Tax=Lujinxingia litoralis TaxID=2211119 RepID=A0A328C4W7_9DELT|nr:helix-turn-helix transcriptional regulator [Lujinxingia litoralis]RAL20920.1 hypothetical protein DL240_14695 [Lujinxingia litoralis]
MAPRWHALVEALHRISTAPQSRPDALTRELIYAATDALKGSRGFLLIITRNRIRPRHLRRDPLGGWSPVRYIPTFATPEHQQRVKKLLRNRSLLASDPFSQEIVRQAGSLRVFLFHEFLAGLPQGSTLPSLELMGMLSTRDRILGCIPMGRTVECILAVDRSDTQPLFNAEDATTLAEFLPRIGRYLVRVLTSHGFLDHQSPLTCRERECYELLLHSLTKAEIAQVMKLSPHSVHQYVSRIYTKLGVNSRTELMSEWLCAEETFASLKPMPRHHDFPGAADVESA